VTTTQSRTHPAVRSYLLICFAALFVVVPCLAERGLEWWCLMPASIGCLTLLAKWNHGPPLVLLSLAGLLGMPASGYLYRQPRWSRYQTPSTMDFFLCAAVLAYVLAHFRFLSLTNRIFPANSRQRDADALSRRSADLVALWEMALLPLVLPLFLGLAVMLWSWLMDGTPPLEAPATLWRMLQLVWLALVFLATAGGVAHYLRRSTATPEESLLYLQDQLWRHTRREQGTIHRWLTWRRERARKKERL
jgi:hypothetical protein